MASQKATISVLLAIGYLRFASLHPSDLPTPVATDLTPVIGVNSKIVTSLGLSAGSADVSTPLVFAPRRKSLNHLSFEPTPVAQSKLLLFSTCFSPSSSRSLPIYTAVAIPPYPTAVNHEPNSSRGCQFE